MMWVTVTFMHIVDEMTEESSWTILAHSWEEAQDKMNKFGRDLEGLTIINFSTQTIQFK